MTELERLLSQDDCCLVSVASIKKALSQQPCDDAISREAVLNKLNNELKYGAIVNASGIERAYEIVNDMPPVTPSRRKGHWIRVNHAQYTDICSNCGFKGHSIDLLSGKFNRFCNMCGAEMESEE